MRVKNSTVSPEEWESILASILLDQGSLEDVEATASVQSESEVAITIRKRVQGITVSRTSNASLHPSFAARLSLAWG